MTELEQLIATGPLVDTHEHLRSEQAWTEDGPDILADLFGNYVAADLITAGADRAAMERLVDASDPDIEGRFAAVQPAWDACRLTGYGRVTALVAERFYGLTELTPAGCAAAAERAAALQQPGERLRLLRDVAGLDHVQTDDFVWACAPDHSGPEFFLYDLSWVGFCNGDIDAQRIAAETSVEVTDLASLGRAMAALFDRYGGCAVAVKAQHAYSRTLLWQERSESAAAAALAEVLAHGADSVDEQVRITLGDWCWARGVELAIEHHLPFKIHTGYYAGNDRMPVSRIAAGNLCALLARYPEARFVLMHIAYPYQTELLAIAKHYPNVWIDLCWAWSINPASSADFLRQAVHSVPINKLFAFGGDTAWPTSAAMYAAQARAGLQRALGGEVADGLLTEAEACSVARRVMRDNQYECFDLAGTRATIEQALAAATKV